MYVRSRAGRTRAANPAALFLGLSLRALALALALAMATAGAPDADSMDSTSAEDSLCTTTVTPISRHIGRQSPVGLSSSHRRLGMRQRFVFVVLACASGSRPSVREIF